MELTDRERKVVLGMRKKAAENEIEKQVRLEILRVAYEFEQWLQDNGAGSSFSTFCDDFGYAGGDDLRRSGLFDAIGFVRNVVHSKAPRCIIKGKTG